MKDPTTPEEWQEAVDQANLLLALDSCKQYGLLEGGPKINFDRCVELLEKGKALGYIPKEIV